MIRTGRWFLVAAAALAACDDGGGDAAAGDAAVAPADAGGDSGGDSGSSEPGSDAEEAAAFCTQLAETRCAWAFRCVANQREIFSELGLPGADEAACAAAEAAACQADVADRAERGTLAWDESVVEPCLRTVGSFRCPPGAAVDWALDWRKYVADRCTGAIGGNVFTNDACEQHSDCRMRAERCIEGACQRTSFDDVVKPCDATGRSLGALNEDPGCAAGVCAHMGVAEGRQTGICTVDCRDGQQVCPDGAACLSLSVQGAEPNWFCVKQCAGDQECGPRAACTLQIPGVSSTQKYCVAQ